MSLETTLERIAVALEENNRIQLALMAKPATSLEPVIEAAFKEADKTVDVVPADEPAHTPVDEEPALDREKLLARCAELGIEVPKGTKTPTLPKLIARKEEELLSVEAEVSDIHEEEETAMHLREEEPAIVEEKKKFTYETASEWLMKNFRYTDRERTLLMSALGQFNLRKFTEAQGNDELANKVISRYIEMVGEHA